MTFVEIMEWTMGWAWPIMLGIVLLMAWGIERIETWDEEELSAGQTSGQIPEKCVCQCT
jgi:hypothetical protein